MIDHQILKQEILTDPEQLGYAASVSVGADLDVALLLNEQGLYPVRKTSLTLAEFLAATLPAILALSGKDAVTQTKWDRLLGVVKSLPVIGLTSGILAVLQGLVTDGLMTQAQVDAIGVRLGSRAEVLFGEGTIVSHQDVAQALRG